MPEEVLASQGVLDTSVSLDIGPSGVDLLEEELDPGEKKKLGARSIFLFPG